MTRFLPPAGRGRVLITSRNALWPSSQAVDVPVLDPRAAADFLVSRTGDPDRQAALGLASELGWLPLALEQAAAYILASGDSLAGYLASFRHRRTEMRPAPGTSTPRCCRSASGRSAGSTRTPCALTPTSPTGPGRRGTPLAPGTSTPRCCPPSNSSSAPSIPAPCALASTSPTGRGRRGTRPGPGRSTPPCCPPSNGSSRVRPRSIDQGRETVALNWGEVAPACSLAPGSQVSPADQRRIPEAPALRAYGLFTTSHRALEHNSGPAISTSVPTPIARLLAWLCMPTGRQNIRICRGQRAGPDRHTPGCHVGAVSAEALCARFHKPLPRKRASVRGQRGNVLSCRDEGRAFPGEK